MLDRRGMDRPDYGERDMEIAANLRSLYGDDASFTYIWAMDIADLTNYMVSVLIANAVPLETKTRLLERIMGTMQHGIVNMLKSDEHFEDVVAMITAEAKRRLDVFLAKYEKLKG